MTTTFHTSHPGLCAALRRDRKWRQVSCALYGTNKRRSGESLRLTSKAAIGKGTGWGGHFRAVQGFRYVGERAPGPRRDPAPAHGGPRRDAEIGAAVCRLLVAWRAREVQLLAVSCPEARPDGSPDPLRGLVEAGGLPWIPAGKLPEETLPEETDPEETDLIIAAHSHDFIGRRTRLRARIGAIGYHPSLLPRHRGRDAVCWTVKRRDPVAGGTVFWLGDSVDAGPIAAQDWCHVGPDDTAESLWREKLFPMGLRLIARTLDELQAERILQQDERYATWEPSWERPPMFRPELTLIGPALEGFEVVRERTA